MGEPSARGDGPAAAAGGTPPTPGRLGRATPLLAGAAALVVYLVTLAPTIGFGDSPELSAAALRLGVPHPTGYPLLMMLGYGFASVFAVGDPAWRLNVLGALIASGAVALAAAFVVRLTARPLAGWVAGLGLAFTPAFWSNANLFEVYGLHAAFVLGLLLAWLRFEQDPRPGRLRVLAAVAGLAVTHHLMVVLILPVLAVATLRHWRLFAHPAELARLAACFALPLGVLAYLPLAAMSDPIVNWGDPSSPIRFWSHVTGRQYHVNVAGEAGAAWWGDGVGFLAGALTGFTPVGVGLALAGAFATLGARAMPGDVRVAGRVLAAIFSVGFCFGSLYQVVDPEPFFLNATFVVALWVGLGAAFLLDWTARRRDAALPVVRGLVLVVPLAPLLIHGPANDRRGEYAAHDLAMAVLTTLPKDAVLLVQGFHGYPPVYASLIEGVREDVLVVDHFLRIRGDGGGYGPALERIRYTRVPPELGLELTVAATAAGLGRPLFVLRDAPELRWADVGLARVRRGLVDQLVPTGSARLSSRAPEGAPMAVFSGGTALLDARVRRAQVEPGDPVPIELSWQQHAGHEDADAEPLRVVVMAGDETGGLIEGADGRPVVSHAHPLGQGLPSSAPVGWLESIVLSVPRALPPGTASLYLALMRGDRFVPADGDRVFVRIGAVDVAERSRAAWTASPAAVRRSRS